MNYITSVIYDTAIGVLTLMIPAELTWFTYAYAAVGFGFGISYAVILVRK